MKTKHTPGPWKEEGAAIIANGAVICVVASDECNARLIAAAPDGLQFALDMVRYLKAGPIASKSDRQHCITMAEAFIQKATRA